MFTLDGFINFELTASGQSIPIGPDSVKALSIIQSVNNMVPVLQGTILDKMGIHAKNNVFADGAPIVVNIGPGDNRSRPSSFRRFNNPEIIHMTGGDLITFSAQFDAPGMRNLQTKAFPQMPSSGAIGAVVSALGLGFEGVSTTDAMNWLPNNRPIAQWLRHVADHGYISGNSAMHLAMGSRGDGIWTMLYKDIIAQAQQSPIVRIVTEGYDSASDISAMGMSSRSHSGTLNAIGGYNQQSYQVGIDGLIKSLTNVVVNMSAVNLDMSSVVKSAITALPFIVEKIERGNTHENYMKSKYQNERLKQTFTGFVSVLTRNYTNLRIMDPVQLVSYINGQVNQTISGKYVVHSRTQHASNTFYRELLVLGTQGVGSGTGLTG